MQVALHSPSSSVTSPSRLPPTLAWRSGTLQTEGDEGVHQVDDGIDDGQRAHGQPGVARVALGGVVVGLNGHGAGRDHHDEAHDVVQGLLWERMAGRIRCVRKFLPKIMNGLKLSSTKKASQMLTEIIIMIKNAGKRVIRN